MFHDNGSPVEETEEKRCLVVPWQENPVWHLGYLLQHGCSRDKRLTPSVLSSISSSVATGIITVLVLLLFFTGLLRNSNEPTFVLKKLCFQLIL